jgi:hypothetical protein
MNQPPRIVRYNAQEIPPVQAQESAAEDHYPAHHEDDAVYLALHRHAYDERVRVGRVMWWIIAVWFFGSLFGGILLTAISYR